MALTRRPHVCRARAGPATGQRWNDPRMYYWPNRPCLVAAEQGRVYRRLHGLWMIEMLFARPRS